MSAARLRSLVVQMVVLFVVLGLVLFGAAGTLAWAPGWTFVALYLGFPVDAVDMPAGPLEAAQTAKQAAAFL